MIYVGTVFADRGARRDRIVDEVRSLKRQLTATDTGPISIDLVLVFSSEPKDVTISLGRFSRQRSLLQVQAHISSDAAEADPTSIDDAAHRALDIAASALRSKGFSSGEVSRSLFGPVPTGGPESIERDLFVDVAISRTSPNYMDDAHRVEDELSTALERLSNASVIGSEIGDDFLTIHVRTANRREVFDAVSATLKHVAHVVRED